MRLNLFPAALAITAYAHLIHGLLTFEAMRDLTELTDDCRGRILDVESGEEIGVEIDPMVAVLSGNGGQTVLQGGDEDGEIEDTVAASLHLLCSSLLEELEKPLNPSSEEQNCTQTTTDYHAFLSSTVKFLYAIQEREMTYRWTSQSPVFDNVAWMQGLWASRKTNKQERSFIEQQIELYRDTGCFGKNEVLRRGVEVVEYLNDLVDLFG